MHKALRRPVFTYICEVSFKMGPCLRRKKGPDIPSHQFFRIISHHACGPGIDREQVSLQVVSTDQQLGMVDKIAIAVLDVAKGFLRLLLRGDVIDHRQGGLMALIS